MSSCDLPMDKIDPKEIWVDQIKTDNELMHGKMNYIQDLVVDSIKEEEIRDGQTLNEINLLKKELEILRSELKKIK